MAGIGHRGFMGRNKGCSDSDGQAFITAAGITDPTQQAAICQLVKDLKGVGSTVNDNNIWSKFVAIYPCVGGTDASHSYNLVNPLLYQVTWQGTTPPTHNADGVVGTGAGFGLSNLLVEDFIDSLGVGGMDSRIKDDYTASSDQKSMGSIFTGANYYIRNSRTATTSAYSYGNTANIVIVNNPDADGLHSIDCDGVNSKYYRNAILLDTSSPNVFNARNRPIAFMATFISPGAGGFIESGVTINWWSMRSHLNLSEMQDLSFAVNKFQTILGR